MVLVFFLSFSFANVFNHSYYGEKDFELFYGKNYPFFRSLNYSNKIILEDHENKEEYLNWLLGFSDNSIRSFLIEELQPASMCPHSEYDKNSDYIRYTFRLLTLSYLFESLKIRSYESQKLDLKSCHIKWKDLIKQCKPHTEDMKRFLKNVPIILEKIKNDQIGKDHSTKEYRKHFSSLETPATQVLKMRLQSECKDCSKDVDEKFINNLQKSCDDDTELFVQICSEKDQLWGLSGQIEVFQLLSNAELLRIINQEGHARGCLQRFSEQNKKKQKYYSQLETIYSDVLNYLTSKQAPYIQGNLFPAGSLKEFSDKGLNNLFEAKSEPLPFIAIYKKQIIQTQKKDSEPLKKSISVPDKKILTEVKKTEAKKVILKSAFSLAGEMRREMDLNYVEVDMDKFKFDFIIPPSVAIQLEKSLKDYMTRKALEEMKKFDNLGTAKGPVPLLFIKYMIDHQQHQGLYNLIAEVGEKFYVTNDLDLEPTIESEYIQLVNNETTNFQWLINIIKP
jgi:hypothetical protein